MEGPSAYRVLCRDAMKGQRHEEGQIWLVDLLLPKFYYLISSILPLPLPKSNRDTDRTKKDCFSSDLLRPKKAYATKDNQVITTKGSIYSVEHDSIYSRKIATQTDNIMTAIWDRKVGHWWLRAL